ncbi:MAG: UDP-N-acetylmuramoyl-tripeptide--D-alanyl-D-alanine ligase [Rhodospirillales bacterium]|nr:UDP-N-acetylmuramoyl-tripeptide--D-alanyl-D-alanine ligase [Rhodospirillales bacterium]
MKTELWTHKDVANATGGKASGEWTAAGISINTRSIKPGDLFFALTGENTDGHKWVADALEKGAAAAVVDHVPDGVSSGANLLLVDDTFSSLEKLGQAGRMRTAAKIIGVTGSVGKTTTKEMLTRAFTAIRKTHASEGGYNNHWGVPVSLARMPADSEIGIFEMGMNHAGEMRNLTLQVRPDLAVITTIAAVHAEYFPDGEQGIAAAKAEIFEGMRPGGTALLPRDNKWFDFLAGQAESRGLKVLSFGEHEAAEARLVSMADDRITAQIGGREMTFTLKLRGRHMAQNALAVLLAVWVLAGDVEKAAAALGEMEALSGRGQRTVVGGVTILDESYNASPVAVRAALKILEDTKAEGRKIAVLGDMKELGSDEIAIHKSLAPDIIAAGVDVLFTSGPLVENLYKAVPAALQGGHEDDSLKLAPIVAQAVRPGDVVLVKGSRGGGEKPRMQYVVEALKGREHG